MWSLTTFENSCFGSVSGAPAPGRGAAGFPNERLLRSAQIKPLLLAGLGQDNTAVLTAFTLYR